MPPETLSTETRPDTPGTTPSSTETAGTPGPEGGRNVRKEWQPTSGDVFTAKFVRDIVIGLVIVLFIGFAGMFVATGSMMVDALNNKSATYLQLRDEVMKQNALIEEQNKNASTLMETLTTKLNTLIYEIRQIKVPQPAP